MEASEVPTPPWVLWRGSSARDPILSPADALSEEGHLEEALVRYQDLQSRTDARSMRTTLMLRQLATLLQMGKSQRVLETASAYLQEENYSLDAVPSGISTMIAYAYVHQDNVDQAIAWFSKAATSNDPGVYSGHAKEALAGVVRRIPSPSFGQFAQRWEADSAVRSLFAQERIRRAGGKGAEPALPASLFQASSYRRLLPAAVVLEKSIPKTESASATVESSTTSVEAGLVPPPSRRAVGVLLPLSGQYAEHALKVKQGIDLAIQQAVPAVDVMYRDTKGDPLVAQAEYEALVAEGVAVVLGPLLVKTSEQVAARSVELGVPLISFTKRAGIPQLGPAVFRLGVTLENQVEELLNYAMEQLNVRRFGMVYPQTEVGLEYAHYFRTAASQAGAFVVADEAFYPNDEAAMQTAVQRVALGQPEAIFVPESLDYALPLLDALEKSESSSAVLLGPALWDDPVAIRGFGQLLEDAVFVTPYHGSSPLPDVRHFSERYVATFSQSPEMLAAQSYDAARLAIAALDVMPARGLSARDALADLPEFDGVTGRLRIDSDGEVRRRMSVLRLFKGEVVEVMTRGSATGFMPGQSGLGGSNATPRDPNVDARLDRAIQDAAAAAQNSAPLPASEKRSGEGLGVAAGYESTSPRSQ